MADATVSTTTALPLIPAENQQTQYWIVRAAQAINRFLRHQGTLTITLAANATTSVIYDSRITLTTAILMTPQTSTAAAEMAGGFYVAPGDGTATIHHSNTADTDKTFIAALRN